MEPIWPTSLRPIRLSFVYGVLWKSLHDTVASNEPIRVRKPPFKGSPVRIHHKRQGFVEFCLGFVVAGSMGNRDIIHPQRRT